MASMVRGYPATSDRSRGWLRYLYRKATTPDNWDKDGEPHAHWDNVTGPPTTSWHRMDLVWVSMWTGTAWPRRISMSTQSLTFRSRRSE